MMDTHHKWNISFKTLIVGFILSVVLTLGAYFLAASHRLTNRALIWAVVGMGVLQVLVQLVFFLHLSIESKPRWNLLTFLFMVLLVAILIGGSIWIMSNLDYHMMMPSMEYEPTH